MSSVARFVGSIPALYDRHLGPVLFEPYARELAARVPSGARQVLELAAGTGRLTRHLLAGLPSDGALIATDLNEPMLAEAQRRVPADSRLRWQVADAQALPLGDATMDVVACQFGLMFVPDKPRALREMRRVLRPGGMLLLSTWDGLPRNPATELLHALACAELPADPPTFMLTPFSLPDPVALRALIAAAGFATIRVDTVAVVGEASSAADLAVGFVRGNPLWNELVERGIDPAAFQARVEQALRDGFGDAPCRTPLSAHVASC
jgi:ubiquinone/menaquinone biosynthesis C-methylase UbiE